MTMAESSPFSPPSPGLLPRKSFLLLLNGLKNRGYRVLGPTIRDGAISWGDINRLEDLPVGWRDHQHPGQYRLEQTNARKYFGIVHGPESIKRQTFVPREHLLTIEKKNKSFSVHSMLPQTERTAVIGVRACDLAGLEIQDRIFLQDDFIDPYYQARRKSLFLIAVNCTRALETCFCASMGTGPRVQSGFDLALTECDEDFLIRAGSPSGFDVFQELPLSPVTPERTEQEREQISACAAKQTRKMDTSQPPQVLYDTHDHPRWDEVATRCLACTNCTMVCPTCFCHTVQEHSDVTHHSSEHIRVWDSCFTQDHGYIHGKNVRPTIKDRYRMWLTHKLASWIDQFGTSGCVGCGRCITWCPVGIDLTEELHALLKTNEQGTS